MFRFFVMFIWLATPVLAETKLLKVGMVICLSGECSSEGKNAILGAELAAQEINANGGILGHRVVLIPEDSGEEMSDEETKAAYKKLKDRENIQFFITRAVSPESPVLAPVIDETAMPYKFTKTSEIFAKKYEAQHGKKPEIVAEVAYDIMNLYADAISQTKSLDVSLIKKELQK